MSVLKKMPMHIIYKGERERERDMHNICFKNMEINRFIFQSKISFDAMISLFICEIKRSRA